MPGPAHDAAGAGAGLAGIFTPPAAAAINHLLQSASWARERLKPFAGKTVGFNLAPFAVTLGISANGEVEDSVPTGAPDARLTLTPGVALRILGAENDAWQKVDISGDTAFAQEILAIAQNLRWDVEADLGRVFGDIAAHRMAQAGDEFRRWQRGAAGSLARSAAVYWTEERPLIATRLDVERFVREVDVLRDGIEQIEQRIEGLEATIRECFCSGC